MWNCVSSKFIVRKFFTYLWHFKAKVYEFKQGVLKRSSVLKMKGDLKAQMFSLKKSDY